VTAAYLLELYRKQENSAQNFLFPLLLVSGLCRNKKVENVESSMGCTFIIEVLF